MTFIKIPYSALSKRTVSLVTYLLKSYLDFGFSVNKKNHKVKVKFGRHDNLAKSFVCVIQGKGVWHIN